MIHQMSLRPHPFEKIKLGEKTIELRLYDEKRKEIKVGDTIEFFLEPEKIEKVNVEVTALLNYKTFSDLIDDFPTSVFGRINKEDLLKALYSFYTKEEESEKTVLGIKIKLIT